MINENNQENIYKILKMIPTETEKQLLTIKNLLHSFGFLNLSIKPNKDNESYLKSIINENAINNDVILFDVKQIMNKQYYFLIMSGKVIIINELQIQQLKPFFDQITKQKEHETKFFFMNEKSKIEGIKETEFRNPFSQIEMELFEDNLIFQVEPKYEQILTLIKPLISNFILIKSFIKTKKNKDFTIKPHKFKDFIFIRNVGTTTNLYFNVKDEILYIIKRFNQYENLSEKRFNKEIQFYEKIGNKHPYIAKYFGHFEHGENKYIVIEYIEGQTLEKIIKEKRIKLRNDEKIKIIIELMMSVEYIHSKGIIIRDLKYDNILVDSNHDIVLIDFDLIKLNEFEDMTNDIGSNLFSAPEQLSNNEYSYKVDLYSIGMLINFIICEEIIESESFLNEMKKELPKFPSSFLCYTFLYKDLLEESPDKRPNISSLINEFLFRIDDLIQYTIVTDNNNQLSKLISFLIKVRLNYLNEIVSEFSNNKSSSSFVDISEIYNFIGAAYFRKEIEKMNVDEMLFYFYLSESLNNAKAQLNLGIFYSSDEYTKPDIEKSFYYLNLSINQKTPRAFYILGYIYLKGDLVPRDIEKTNYYFSFCATYQDFFMLYKIGSHYLYDKYLYDPNKSIYFFTLSSKLHNSLSQSILAIQFYDGKYIKRDIDKAIHYSKLAINQGNIFCKLIMGNLSSSDDISNLQIVSKDSLDKHNSIVLFNTGLQYYDGDMSKRNIHKAIHYFELSAQKNNQTAQRFLGMIYTKNAEVRNINKAIHYLTLLSNNNDSNAQYFLGINYLEGKHFPRDLNKGINYLTTSSKNNNKDAQFSLGFEYFNGNNIKRDINKALYYFQLSANQNNVMAQIILGIIYNEGKYLPKDINKSIYYYNLAAKQDNNLAHLQLGLIYLTEKNFFDINKSIYYLTVSAYHNNSHAQYLLGDIYLTGEYIKTDINKSIYYLELSSKQYHSDANCLLGEIYMDGTFLPQNINKTIHYLTVSANLNNERAQFLLGNIYYQKKYNKQDKNKGVHYFMLSANKGFPNSCLFVGNLHYSGKHVQHDYSKAIHYYKEASNQNFSFAKNNLGFMYLEGIGVERNVFYAIEYFNEAIKISNDVLALYNLSRIYYFGIEIEQNIQESFQLLKEASQKQFFVANLILYLIFQFDEKYYNPVESNKNKEIIKKNVHFDDFDSFKNKEVRENVFKIFKNTSLNYTNNGKNISLLFFDLLNLSDFIQQKSKNTSSFDLKNRRRDIDANFYMGFGK